MRVLYGIIVTVTTVLIVVSVAGFVVGVALMLSSLI